MSSAEWYYAQDDHQIGPVSSGQMKQLAGSGVLQPADLVWRDGMEEWVAARQVKGLFGVASSRAAETFSGGSDSGGTIPEMTIPPPVVPDTDLAKPSRRAVGHLFDALLAFVRTRFNPRFVDSTARMFGLFGHYGLYAAMLLYFLFSLSVGIKNENLLSIQLGCGAVLILAVLQYTAHRLWRSLHRLRQMSMGSLSSTELPDCLASLCLAAGVIILLSRAVFGIETDDYRLILSGLPGFILFAYLAFVVLNLQMLNVTVVANLPAKDEAVGILAFLMKAGLQVVPVAYGVGVVAGIIRMLYAGYLAFGADVQMQTAEGTAFEAVSSIAFYAALPLLSYLGFLFGHLCVELMRSTLSIPSKLHELAEKDQP